MTYREMHEEIIDEYCDRYREWLRGDDNKQAFDDVDQHMHNYRDCAGELNPRGPDHTERVMLFDALLGQQREIRELGERVDKVEEVDDGGETEGV